MSCVRGTCLLWRATLIPVMLIIALWEYMLPDLSVFQEEPKSGVLRI